MTNNLQVLWQGQNILGEGPLWNPRTQQLFWVDIEGKLLQCFDWRSQQYRSWDMPDLLCCIALHQQDGLIAALRGQIAHIALPSGQVTILKDVFPLDAPVRFNDGKCDSYGRFWVNTMAKNERDPLGKLYCFDGHDLKLMDEGFIIANGMGWNLQQSKMYVTDSIQGCIFEYDFCLATGAINNRRIFIRMPKKEGVPDGLTIDANGNFWSAQWDGWRINHYDAEGHLIDIIALPVQRPTSCCLGGPNKNILFITSDSRNLANLAKQPLAGSVFSYTLK